MNAEREILNASGAAQLLGVSRRSIWDWARCGMIPHRRLGGRLLSFRRDELLQWHSAQPGRSVAEALERSEGVR